MQLILCRVGRSTRVYRSYYARLIVFFFVPHNQATTSSSIRKETMPYRRGVLHRTAAATGTPMTNGRRLVRRRRRQKPPYCLLLRRSREAASGINLCDSDGPFGNKPLSAEVPSSNATYLIRRAPAVSSRSPRRPPFPVLPAPTTAS